MALIPLFAPGGLGSPELIVILLLAVLLFGANKIPKLARSTGQAIGEFQRGREELEEELDEVRDAASIDEGAAGSDSTGTDSADAQSGTETTAREETASRDSDSGSETNRQ
jgi:sec-independent protein translocase protein TatA